MAQNITYFVNLIVIEIMIRNSPDFEQTFIPIGKDAFTGWGEYMSIGLYSATLECLGWWNLNICFLFSGYLGTTEIAAQVVIMQIKDFSTMIP